MACFGYYPRALGDLDSEGFRRFLRDKAGGGVFGVINSDEGGGTEQTGWDLFHSTRALCLLII